MTATLHHLGRLSTPQSEQPSPTVSNYTVAAGIYDYLKTQGRDGFILTVNQRRSNLIFFAYLFRTAAGDNKKRYQLISQTIQAIESRDPDNRVIRITDLAKPTFQFELCHPLGCGQAETPQVPNIFDRMDFDSSPVYYVEKDKPEIGPPRRKTKVGPDLQLACRHGKRLGD